MDIDLFASLYCGRFHFFSVHDYDRRFIRIRSYPRFFLFSGPLRTLLCLDHYKYYYGDLLVILFLVKLDDFYVLFRCLQEDLNKANAELMIRKELIKEQEKALDLSVAEYTKKKAVNFYIAIILHIT